MESEFDGCRFIRILGTQAQSSEHRSVIRLCLYLVGSARVIAAYSELVFLNVPWLKCDVEHIQMAIGDFQRRDRRFGGVDS